MDRKVERTIADALETANKAIGCSAEAIEQTRRIYGTTLLTRGVLWMATYAASRGLLEVVDGPAMRAAVASTSVTRPRVPREPSSVVM